VNGKEESDSSFVSCCGQHLPEILPTREHVSISAINLFIPAPRCRCTTASAACSIRRPWADPAWKCSSLACTCSCPWRPCGILAGRSSPRSRSRRRPSTPRPSPSARGPRLTPRRSRRPSAASGHAAQRPATAPPHPRRNRLRWTAGPVRESGGRLGQVGAGEGRRETAMPGGGQTWRR